MEVVMNRSAKRYFDWAYEYQIAALTLHIQLVNSPYLYNPIIFLLRHAIELQLKGLIISEVKSERNTRNDQITIGKQKRKLKQTHSLQELWVEYTSIAHSQIDDEVLQLISKVIRRLNRKDPYSDRYRYPQSKKNRNFETEPIQLDFSGKTLDLSKGIPHLMFVDGTPVVIEKGAVLLSDLIEIVEVTELLFDLSEL